MTKRLTHEQITQKVQEGLARGIESLEEFSRFVGKAPSTIYAHINKEDIDLSHLTPWPYRPKIDDLLDQGLNLREVGERLDLSLKSIHMYLVVSGQSREYKKRKKETALRKRQERSRFVSLLEERGHQLATAEGWPQQQALRYISLSGVRSSKYDDLVTVLTRYERARNEERRLSLKELSHGTRIWFSDIGRILRKLDLEPMYGTLEKRGNLSGDEVSAIQRAYNQQVSSFDVGYFMNCPHYIVYQRWDEMEGKRQRERYLFRGWQGRRIAYRNAAQIYEANDLGFSTDEIAQLVEKPVDLVELTLERRDEFEPKIIGLLEVLYPDREITTPYL